MKHGFKKFLLAFSFTFLVFSLNAEDLIIPVIKSPYAITGAEWDKNSSTFAYITNNRVFIRNSQDFELIDTYIKKQDVTLFSKDPGKSLYPKSDIVINGRSLSIYSKKSANDELKVREIENLPVNIKNTAINRSNSILAITGTNNTIYIYDLESQKQIVTLNCNPVLGAVKFTHDDKILYSDTSKTIKLYDLNTKESKTFMSSKNISALELSADEETLVFSCNDGTIYVYDTKQSRQLGYIPTLNNKNIDGLCLSANSKKLLATGDDGSVFIIRMNEALFSPNTIAPPVTPYQIAYNALNGNKNSPVAIIEYGNIEDDYLADSNAQAEYIQEFHEEKDSKQIFELDEEAPPAPVVIHREAVEPQTFPQTNIKENPDEVVLSQKNPNQENQNLIKEFKSEEKTLLGTEQNQEKTPVAVAPVPTQIPSKNPEVENQKTVENPNGQNGSQYPYGGTYIENLTIITSDSSQTPEKSEKEIAAEEKAKLKEEKLAEKEALKAEREEEKLEKEALREAESEERKREREEKKENKIPFKERLEQDDIKYYFKDGHGVMVDITYKKMVDPYNFEIGIPMGYRNYNLIRPFYFGGTIEPYFGVANEDFPFQYTMNGEVLQSPSLVGSRFYVPAGICVFPFKNSLEIYTEIGIGLSVTSLWNNYFPPNMLLGKPYAAFYGNLKVGVMWDFLNINFNAAYDGIFGFSAGVEIGAIVNIGGSRKMTSMSYK